MSRPPVDTSWATASVVFNVLDEAGNSTLVLNKSEPSTSYKLNGCVPDTPVIGDYINYFNNSVHRLLEWTISSEVGRVIEFADSAGKTASSISSDFGGTWVDQGTYTKAGLLTRVFVKTAD